MSPRVRRLRSEKHVYLIVTEGETEKYYFEGLKEGLPREVQTRIRISNPNDTDLSSLIKFSCDQIPRLDLDLESGDRIFLIVDHPERGTKGIQRMIKQAESRGIEIIITRPCFELWLLLHHCPVTRSMSNKDTFSQLKRYISNYRKADPKIFLKVKTRTDNAIRNAKKIEGNFNDVRNPSTRVHTVVEFLLGIAEKGE